MLRQTFKSLMLYSFCSVNPPVVDYQTLRDRLLKFPYSRLSQKLYTKTCNIQQNDFIGQNIIKDSIAYASLTQPNVKQLQSYYNFLFSDQEQGNGNHGFKISIQRLPEDEGKNQGILAGRKIFQRYFSGKIQQIKDRINTSDIQQQINYNLKTLFYLKTLNPKLTINLPKIQKNGTLQQKTYLLHLYGNQPNFLTYLENYIKQFESASNQNKFKAALIVISIPDFSNKFSSKFNQECIDKIGDNIENMKSWEIFRTLQLLFQTKFTSTKKYLDKVMKQLFKSINQQFNQMNIPIFLKLIKLRDKLRMDNSQFEKYAKQQPIKFMSIFLKRKVNKDVFLQIVATKDSRRYLPQQIRAHFVNYIVKIFNDIVKQGQCDSQELIQNVKLAVKYFYNFTPAKLQALTKLLQQQLIPMFSHEYQSCFWLLMLLFRIDIKYIKKMQINKQMNNVLNYYHEKYLSSKHSFQKHTSLQKITQLYYQMIRAQLPINTKNLQLYDFRNVRTFQQVIYACSVLIKLDLTASKKYQIFKQLMPRLQTLLYEKHFKSLKNLYNVVGALNVSKCQQSMESKNIGFIYKAIQVMFMYLIGRQKYCPKQSDLLYMKRGFTEKRSKQVEGTKNHIHNYQFVKFLDNCINHPQNFRKSYEEYQSNTHNNVQKKYKK